MRVGQRAPTDPLAGYAARSVDLEAEVAELKRLLSRSALTSSGTFTVTVTQGAATPTKTTTYANWYRTGNIVHWAFSVTFTGAGAAGSQIIAAWSGMPTAAATPVAAASFEYFDTPGVFYVGEVRWASATSWLFRGHLETGNLGVDPNFAIASGDAFSAAGWYPV